ncbi:MAG: cytochrome C oxidase subunit IV family protein [Anaerolineales bacterium]|nr:cytochrome C oxidase subunit IV family protein [Anaerolineales bacterium]
MEHTPAIDITHAAEAPHAHPKIDYVRIFAWLSGFTLLELLISFVPVEEIKIPLLVGFAVLKATLVVLYYMHLRYDSRWYAVILIVGIFFAVVVGILLPRMQRGILPLP